VASMVPAFYGCVKAPEALFCLGGLTREIDDPAVGRGLPFVAARSEGR
jgi:hypothetical protein